MGTKLEFKEALLELDVLPQITPSGSIAMALNITKDEPDQRQRLEQPAPYKTAS
jgi:type IV pilus assembly protein PilQ